MLGQRHRVVAIIGRSQLDVVLIDSARVKVLREFVKSTRPHDLPSVDQCNKPQGCPLSICPDQDGHEVSLARDRRSCFLTQRPWVPASPNRSRFTWSFLSSAVWDQVRPEGKCHHFWGDRLSGMRVQSPARLDRSPPRRPHVTPQHRPWRGAAVPWPRGRSRNSPPLASAHPERDQHRGVWRRWRARASSVRSKLLSASTRGASTCARKVRSFRVSVGSGNATDPR